MQKILVPVDFSQTSAYGSSLAAKIATYLNAEIHFLHVVNLPSHILLKEDGSLLEDGDFDTSIPKEKMKEAQEKMPNWLASYSPLAKSHFLFGHANEAILNFAKKNSVDLIIMGTHAVSGAQELLSHTHGEYIAMHSPSPVITLKCDRSDMEVKSIVIASSFKTEDIPHVEMALALQKALNAKLYLLRVNTPKDFMADGKVLNNMKAFVEKHNLHNVELAIYNDEDVEDGIVHYVAKENIDIICIGSWQRTGINKLINGCVSSDLVNHVYKPILTFKLKN
ncbi:MAG: universal stress protein [Bacteroidia bacterium]|nr:universal stress protein [Bacteroidia bacterium]